MQPDKLLQRINELAHRSKTDALTDAEMKEQGELRKEYLKMIRGQVESQLSTIQVVDEEGNDMTPDKLKQLKKDRKDN